MNYGMPLSRPNGGRDLTISTYQAEVTDHPAGADALEVSTVPAAQAVHSAAGMKRGALGVTLVVTSGQSGTAGLARLVHECRPCARSTSRAGQLPT